MSDKANKPEKASMKQGMQLFLRGAKLVAEFEPRFLGLETIKELAAVITPAAVVFFSSRIVAELAGGKDINRLVFLVACTIGLAFLLTCILAVTRQKSQLMEMRFMRNFDVYLYSRISQLDYQDTEQASIMHLFQNMLSTHWALGGGVVRTYRYIPLVFSSLFGTIISAILLAGMFQTKDSNVRGGFITSQWASILLILLVITVVLITAGIGAYYQKKVYKLMEDLPNTNQTISYYDKYIRPSEAGKDIRIYHQEKYVYDIIKNRHGGVNLFIGECSANSRKGGINAILLSSVHIITYLLVGLRALYGMYQIGDVVQYVGAIGNLVNSLTLLSYVATEIWTNTKFLTVQYEYLDIAVTKKEGTKQLTEKECMEGMIEFHDVSFQYPGTSKWALRHFSIRFPVGKRVAVVGQNGSGKTTMAKLLCGLYEPTEGYITFNGVNIKEYDYEEYKKILSVVFQDFALPSLPIGQVVASDLSYNEEKAKACLKKAGVEERIEKLPDGLLTYLDKAADKDGVSLSGGEKQKIALARALYRDAPVIILDEPTAALDPISEHEIYTHFDQMVSGKTAVYISHRLSSCQFCDWILVFDQGELVGTGSHDELLKEENEIYCKLWNAQAQYYQEGEYQQG